MKTYQRRFHGQFVFVWSTDSIHLGVFVFKPVKQFKPTGILKSILKQTLCRKIDNIWIKIEVKMFCGNYTNLCFFDWSIDWLIDWFLYSLFWTNQAIKHIH